MKIYELQGTPQDTPFTANDARVLADSLRASLDAAGVAFQWGDAGPLPGTQYWRIGDIGVYSGYDVQRAQFLIKALAYEKTDA